jgi:O-antigen ligase
MGELGRATDSGGFPVCYCPTMTRPWSPRPRRRVLAVALAAVAIGLVVVEPFPKGAVLMSFTESHGIDASDLPAICLLVLVVWLAL